MDADRDRRHRDPSTAAPHADLAPELIPARTLEALTYHVAELNRLLRHLQQTRPAMNEAVVGEVAAGLEDDQGTVQSVP
jgi:hypothetical protein